ncbi:epimerase [Actinoplanes siamensis]|uniref:Epimerase n=1 Tax=Actinoplanes siamensis TaxID=1223317 RepID=A0A919N3N5_9ACTN|nr:epimerase [Actinoplanes siamensis]
MRVLARALGLGDPVVVDDLSSPRALAGADRVLHLAGINRGDVDGGNRELAERLATGLRRCATPPRTVVFANSVRAGDGTPYGTGKAAAAEVLAEATRWSGSAFEDVRLPNVFGEHGRPHYNSVVATFCRQLVDGVAPRVHEDRELRLLHATDAAALLLGRPAAGPVRCGVAHLRDRLTGIAQRYAGGEIPAPADRLDVRLFNTYRSHHFPAGMPFALALHADDRGRLVEAVRAHGGGGQVFVSTTRPGATRGGHFHLAKVERFLVLRGTAEIRVRRLLHAGVRTFRVRGDRPAFVDMPAMWAHEIINVGDSELLTLFWANEVHDAGQPDTYPERVGR